METPFTHAAFKPDAAFASAAERFFELLKTFGIPGAAAAGTAQDWSSLAGTLAGQFEAWLRSSQSAGPWFAAANAASPLPGGGFGAAQPGSFGPLPLGAGAAPNRTHNAPGICSRDSRSCRDNSPRTGARSPTAPRGASSRAWELRRAARRRSTTL